MHYFPRFTAKQNKQYHRGSFLPGKISSPCSSNGSSFVEVLSTEFAISESGGQADVLGSWKVQAGISTEHSIMKLSSRPGFRQIEITQV